MAAHTDTNQKADLTSNSSKRWRFNANGQLVDSEAGWDLADEIVRLNIGDTAGDKEDTAIRTPPKSKQGPVTLAESSPLDTSSADSSPQSDSQVISHSRGSSTSSRESTHGPSPIPNPAVKGASASEMKERPHSFSGGLSSADLRRLQESGEGVADMENPLQQQQHWAAAQYLENLPSNDQPSYPSLGNNFASNYRPPLAGNAQLQDLRNLEINNIQNREDASSQEFTPRNFQGGVSPHTAYYNRGSNGTNSQNRQRSFQPNVSSGGYTGQTPPHLNLANTQQLYDMMLPGPGLEGISPALARVQQQHNVFRGGHHPSTSDPIALRDAATLALLNGGIPPFSPGLFPTALGAPPGIPMYANQFYRAQDAYPSPDPATAAQVIARLQSQYNSPYGMLTPQLDTGLPSPTTSSSGQNGPSANNRKLGLYKTELCRSWEEKGSCRYGAKCQFAHGEEELRRVSRHPKYKTEICRTFWVSGSCPYGKRCCFIHTELPTSGGATGSSADGTPTPPQPDGRARSHSTNSDPNDASVSLLARISAKRGQETTSTNSSSTPVDTPSNFQFTRPPTGSLRVDTALDGPAKQQQNKSAYPTFASNGILMQGSDRVQAKSPAPVTAGPDFGRHNDSRLQIVGYNSRVKTTTPPSNAKTTGNGQRSSDDMSFSPSPPVSGHYGLSSGEGQSRVNGHVRAGSAGNWGSITRTNQSSHLSTASAYPHAPSPVADKNVTSPWSTTELAVGSSRFGDKGWA